LRISRIQTIKI